MKQPDLNDAICKAINVLFESAGLTFRNTDQYKQLSENHNEKANAYESALSERERDLVNDYLAALSELNAAEIDFIYVRGYTDCVFILKKLGVL